MSVLEVEEIDQADDEVTSLEEGRLLDYITGEPVKDTPKEQVRQRIARAFFTSTASPSRTWSPTSR